MNQNYSEEIRKLGEEIRSADAIVIGAGAGLAYEHGVIALAELRLRPRAGNGEDIAEIRGNHADDRLMIRRIERRAAEYVNAVGVASGAPLRRL